jgi:hypothetical protein
MPDTQNGHQTLIAVNLVDDAEVAHTDAPLVFTIA